MDREINKIEVRLSESESVMYRDDVYDGTYENESIFSENKTGSDELARMYWEIKGSVPGEK